MIVVHHVSMCNVVSRIGSPNIACLEIYNIWKANDLWCGPLVLFSLW